MKKYVSRAKNRAALVLLIAFLILAIIGYLSSSRTMIFLSLPLFLAGVILMLTTNRCSHCGEHFRGIYWSKPNAGHCVKCGKIIVFDDYEY